MSDFSKSPQEVLRDSQDKGYTGIHIEQGVPILDRDLNLMHDLLAYRYAVGVLPLHRQRSSRGPT